LDLVRQLAREQIAPRAALHDRESSFPWENVKALNALEMNKVFLPPPYGFGLSYACYLNIVKEISKACASTGIIWATNCHAGRPMADFCSDEQKERFLPVMASGGLAALAITEPQAGSDATGMQTTFTPDGDEIVVDGSKVLITNGDVADLYLLFGKWSEIEDPRRAISVLVMEKGTPGLTVGRKEDKLGHRASSTAGVFFDHCRVPRQSLLCAPGDGLKILLSALNKSRPSIGAQALGIARAAFEDAVEYINQRQQFGKRVIEFQGIQFMLADMATKLAMTEIWMQHVASLLDAGVTDIATEASMFKLTASDLAMEISTNAVQLLGGYGYCSEYRAERLFRDAKITQIWEGTNQIQRQIIAKQLLK